MRKEINKTILELELQKFHTVVEQTADAVFITDSAGIIEYVNPAFEHMTGYAKHEAIGRTPNLVKSGMYSKDHYTSLWNTLLSGKPYQSVMVNKKKNGELFYADHTITPIKANDTTSILFVGIWKDITERMVLEQKRDEFISLASHELKTPLTSIKVYEQLLRRKLTDEVSLGYLEKMGKQIHTLAELVDDLLDVSKIETGKIPYSLSAFDFDQLVFETVAALSELENRHILVIKGKTKKVILADRDRIQQVLINLITNAITYSAYQKNIEIQLDTSETSVICSVKDHGIGILRDDWQNIFQKFYRVEHTSRTYPGMGIGLYITKDIITRHQGTVTVESTVGKGSTFSFELPTFSYIPSSQLFDKTSII